MSSSSSTSHQAFNAARSASSHLPDYESLSPAPPEYNELFRLSLQDHNTQLEMSTMAEPGEESEHWAHSSASSEARSTPISPRFHQRRFGLNTPPQTPRPEQELSIMDRVYVSAMNSVRESVTNIHDTVVNSICEAMNNSIRDLEAMIEAGEDLHQFNVDRIDNVRDDVRRLRSDQWHLGQMALSTRNLVNELQIATREAATEQNHQNAAFFHLEQRVNEIDQRVIALHGAEVERDRRRQHRRAQRQHRRNLQQQQQQQEQGRRQRQPRRRDRRSWSSGGSTLAASPNTGPSSPTTAELRAQLETRLAEVRRRENDINQREAALFEREQEYADELQYHNARELAVYELAQHYAQSSQLRHHTNRADPMEEWPVTEEERAQREASVEIKIEPMDETAHAVAQIVQALGWNE